MESVRNEICLRRMLSCAAGFSLKEGTRDFFDYSCSQKLVLRAVESMFCGCSYSIFGDLFPKRALGVLDEGFEPPELHPGSAPDAEVQSHSI